MMQCPRQSGHESEWHEPSRQRGKDVQLMGHIIHACAKVTLQHGTTCNLDNTAKCCFMSVARMSSMIAERPALSKISSTCSMHVAVSVPFCWPAASGSQMHGCRCIRRLYRRHHIQSLALKTARMHCLQGLPRGSWRQHAHHYLVYNTIIPRRSLKRKDTLSKMPFFDVVIKQTRPPPQAQHDQVYGLPRHHDPAASVGTKA